MSNAGREIRIANAFFGWRLKSWPEPATSREKSTAEHRRRNPRVISSRLLSKKLICYCSALAPTGVENQADEHHDYAH